MINVLLRTEWIIVCFIEIGNIGNLLALRKSDTFDIKPRVETSIVKLATVLSAIRELQHLDILIMIIITIMCTFDVPHKWKAHSNSKAYHGQNADQRLDAHMRDVSSSRGAIQYNHLVNNISSITSRVLNPALVNQMSVCNFVGVFPL